ncbi:MAG: rhamnosidase, partial [bacterium]
MSNRRFCRRHGLLLTSTLAVLGLPPATARAQAFHLERLRTEYASNPIGIDEPAPRLSWMLHADRRGTMQSAYEIRVARSAADLGGRSLWSSGKVASGESVNRAYGGPALEPRTRYHWQVRSWDDRGRASDWSTPAYWETGMMGGAQWK